MPSISARLFDQLAHSIKGDVSIDFLDRYLLATDGSIFQKVPAAAVYPKSVEDVASTVNFARRNHLTVHPRGAGSGLCGSALGAGIVIDFSRYMNRLLSLDIKSGQFECEPGYRFGELSSALTESGWFFPPDPSSGEYASFGGMYATNASGAHSVKYGNVADYIVDAQVVLSSGKIITLAQIAQTPLPELKAPFSGLRDLYQKNRSTIESAYPDVRHNVAGYNLRSLIKQGHLNLGRLLAGAEGTLGIVTRLTFRLLAKPAHASLIVAFFDGIDLAAKAVKEILPTKPAGIEIMDKSLLNLARDNDPLLKRKIPEGIDNVLLIEYDGVDQDQTHALARRTEKHLRQKRLTENLYLALTSEEKKKFWAVRTAAVPILYRLKGQKKILALIEDAVVPPLKLEQYFKGLYAILNRHKVRFVLYGHIAKGLIHTRPLLNLKDPQDIALLRVIADEVFELVHGLKGVVSGEHGDGRLRSAYIARQYPVLYPLFLQVKHLLDPENMFNPDIKTRNLSTQMQQDLRYGATYRSFDINSSNLIFKDGLIDEIEKCHGCSKCTTITTATRMCPIYKFTRRESATPKAKANILRALISGAIGAGSIYHEKFQNVIRECVNCGSCKIECPSHVDIPRLALEARSRFARHKGVGLSSHLVARVEEVGRLMTMAKDMQVLPEMIMSTDFFGKIKQKFLGLSEQRPLLTFSRHTLWQQHFRSSYLAQKKVLYFAGCYAGYIRPQIGQALFKVLKQHDLNVVLPEQHCCGLPLLAKGLVKEARQKVRANLSKWYHLLDTVDHIVVTCSSCGFMLMSKWAMLLNDGAIRNIERKVIHVSHLLLPYLKTKNLSRQPRDIAYHIPCHLKIQPHAQSSARLLSRLPGVNLKVLDSHCCGMAGTWGMHAENYPLSHEMGNHLINLIDIENTNEVTTDCPTCEIQLTQLGHYPVFHPIEVMARHIA